MKKYYFRWQLLIYDVFILLAVDLLLLVFYTGGEVLSWNSVLFHS